jgi:hypothetical protein
MSKRRPCAVLDTPRSSRGYRVKPGRLVAVLLEGLRQLAAKRPRFGYRRLTVPLRRSGGHPNHKRVYCLYRREGLAVRHDSKQPRQDPETPARAAQARSADTLRGMLPWFGYREPRVPRHLGLTACRTMDYATGWRNLQEDHPTGAIDSAKSVVST